MLSDWDDFTCIRCSEITSHVPCEQEPVGETAAPYRVLQVGSSSLMSLVRGHNHPGDVWRLTVPMSGLEGGVAKSFLEVRARR